MNTIVYTADFEPITAINLPAWAAEQIKARGWVSVSFLSPVQVVEYKPGEPIPPPEKSWCELRAASIDPLLIVTNDEEQALALASTWLPGQMRAVAEERREGGREMLARLRGVRS